MILAAGLGTRLRPLTNNRPKPLLHVGRLPLIDHTLNLLRHSTITEVMLNLHYLPNMIRDHIGNGKRYGIKVFYSFEPQIMGTGGGVKNVADFFGHDPFLIINGDILLTEFPSELVMTHLHHNTDMPTLLIRQMPSNCDFTPIDVNSQGKLTNIGTGAYHYAGIMVGTKPLLDILPPLIPSCLIRNGIIPLLSANQQIMTCLHRGYWNDIGTPERLAQARQDFC